LATRESAHLFPTINIYTIIFLFTQPFFLLNQAKLGTIRYRIIDILFSKSYTCLYYEIGYLYIKRGI